MQNLLEICASQSDLSLYIHLPFCIKKCGYCAFYSLPAHCWDEALQRQVCERIISEVTQVRVSRNEPFSTIYVGGGDPGTLPEGMLERILESAGAASEITVEMNPESLVRKDPAFLKQITRLSLGVQSLNDSSLALLGRQADRRTVQRALTIARKSGVKLNCDIITCIPGQTPQLASADIHALFSQIMPDHLSLYALTLDEGSKLSANSEFLPLEERAQADILFSNWELLSTFGYEQYEISNFCKPGNASIHNSRYWDLLPYVGIGPAAVGTLHTTLRIKHPDSVMSWAQGELWSNYEVEQIGKLEAMEEYLMVRLRTAEGLFFKTWETRFGRSLDDCLDVPLNTIISRWNSTYYVCDELRLRLTREGWMVMDALLVELFCSLDKAQKH